jgi:hypothetical protein
MRFDGSHAEKQLCGDLAVGMSQRDQEQDFELPGGEAVGMGLPV